MLDKTQQAHLKGLLEDPRWEVVVLCAAQIYDFLNKQSVLRDTEWNTLVATISRESKSAAIQEFLDELDRLASE